MNERPVTRVIRRIKTLGTIIRHQRVRYAAAAHAHGFATTAIIKKIIYSSRLTPAARRGGRRGAAGSHCWEISGREEWERRRRATNSMAALYVRGLIHVIPIYISMRYCPCNVRIKFEYCRKDACAVLNTCPVMVANIALPACLSIYKLPVHAVNKGKQSILKSHNMHHACAITGRGRLSFA